MPAVPPAALRDLRPSHTIGRFPWSSTGGRWSLRPRSVAALWSGLWIFGIGDALLINAQVGNTPWTVLAQGIGERTGLSIGVLTIAIGLVVLLAWIPLGERPGFGTVSNVIIIGVAIDTMTPIVPSPTSLGLQVLQATAGVLVTGLAIALYLSTHLGPGPRDGWMTAIHERSGWPIWKVRLAIELSVLVVGAALGGDIGIGTAMFALGVGYVMAVWLSVLAALVR